MTLEQRVGEVTDYFENMVGGPAAAGELLAPWPIELCAAMFLDAALNLSGSSRWRAIVVWAVIMNAYKDMTRGHVVH